MAFTDFESRINEAAIVAFMARRRPPEHIRPRFDLEYEQKGQAFEFVSVYPGMGGKGPKIRNPVARIKFVRTQDMWLLYWKRADMKWHQYEPAHQHTTLASALKTVDEDKYCCFWG
jgi:hypothetical protein